MKRNHPSTLMPLRWTSSVGLCLALISVSGCLRLLSLDYQASNSTKGQGLIHVEPFQYQAADERRVRPHEVETPKGSEAELFLSETIGTVFTQALELELARSGYTITPSGPRTISGIVTRFYLDWTQEAGRRFELQATYVVQSEGHQPFSWHCSSAQMGPDMLQKDAVLIKAGIADCMQHFLLAALDAQVL